MLTGIIFQLIIITCFSVLAYEFMKRHTQDRPIRSTADPDETSRGHFEGRLQTLVYALAANTAFLYIRAIYRTVELADGFQGKIITTEWLFIVFDALLVLLAMLTFNVFHVGRLMESEDAFKLKLKGSNDTVEDLMLNSRKFSV
ncbi:envelope glycoprotein [Stygiomarasmius scandens]|uniref:Envelope glycoprotein n=1 Tax=Marasmiellus scandens TaxID=2682957 RepID=A0ABR1JHY9_9AGAR